MNRARQLANKIVTGINTGAFPKSAIRMTAKQIQAAWVCSDEDAHECAMILADCYK